MDTEEKKGSISAEETDRDEALKEAVSKVLVEKEEPLDMKKEVISWVKMLVTVIVVVIVLTQVVFINARVPSSSMENTVMTKDRFIGFRFSYWFGEPERGDIVVFAYPVHEKETYVKRVIGLPGEIVTIKDGLIYIDDSTEPLEENYLPEEWYRENDGFVFVVPDDSYLMLGDNRNNSSDARYWPERALASGVAATPEEAEAYSYVTKKQIKGKAIFTYYKGFKKLTKTAAYQN